MLARRKAKLPFYLNALREKEYAEKYPGCLLNNFHNLLRFWQRHYLNKDKDSTCLENVSALSRVTSGCRGHACALCLTERHVVSVKAEAADKMPDQDK